jgi:hypothetical protein
MSEHDPRQPPPTEHILYDRMFVDRRFSEQAFDDRTFATDLETDEQ